jgi:hypothetical protein
LGRDEDLMRTTAPERPESFLAADRADRNKHVLEPDPYAGTRQDRGKGQSM